MEYTKKLTTEKIEKILSRGVRDMPQNPAAQGYSESQIRGFYYIPEQEILQVVQEIEEGLFNEISKSLGEDDVVDKLDSEETSKPLSANQGRELAKRINLLNQLVEKLQEKKLFVFASELPQPPSEKYEGLIYLIPRENGTEGNYFEEYGVVKIEIPLAESSYKWEKLGETSSEGVLSQILVDNFLSETSENPVQNKVITEAFKNKVSFTDKASQTKYGVVKTYDSYGVQMYGGDFLATNPANDADINSRDSSYKPITPKNFDKMLKAGITGYIAPGNGTGTYGNQTALTDEEKASACEWLGASRGGGKLYLHDITLKTQVAYDPEFGAEINDVLRIKILSKKSTAFEFDNLLKERNSNGTFFNMVSGYFYKEQIAGATEIAEKHVGFSLMAVEGNKYDIVDEGANSIGILDPTTVTIIDSVEEIQYPLLGN